MRAVVVFNILIALVFIIIVLFQFLLHRSMKKSLYNYRNVAFIAGIIFGFVILILLYRYLIDCLINVKTMRVYYIFKELLTFPDTFAKIALPVVLIICILISISNLALIRHEGFRMRNILGFILGLIFFLLTYSNKYVEEYIENEILFENGPFDTPEFWVIHTYSQLFIVLMICYLDVYFIATVIMAYLASKQIPHYNKDFIIILGCAIDKKGRPLPLLKSRTDRAVRYAWEQEIDCGKPIRFIPSGGKGMDEVISEGSAVENYLMEHGVEPYEIFAEKKSRNTYENFLFSKQIIEQIEPDARVAFATTNYHVYRSGVIAKKLGIRDVEGVGSKTKWYFWPNGFVREFVAILAMEKLFHIISCSILLICCIIMAFISYYVFNVYWI